MGLMNFLSSPMGSLVAGAAARAEDIYWNVTRPEQKEAEKAFAQLIKEKKAKYNAAVSSGTALRSKLMSGANVLLNTEGFEGQSPEDLAATIQMVKDAGLAKSHPEAVKYILENRDNYTIKKPQVKDTKTTDIDAQTTGMLTGGGGAAPDAPPKEDRGVLTRMLHGDSERTIQDRVLKSLGMTRKDLNKLYSTPVLKQLNIGKPVIQFALKKKISPFIMSGIENIRDSLTKSNSTDIQINMGKDQNGQPVIMNGEAFELEIMDRLAEASETGDLSGVLPMLNKLNAAKADKNFPGLASQIPKIYDNLTAAYKFMGSNTPGQSENRTKVTELVNEINKFINISLEATNLSTQEKKANLVEVNKLQSQINVLIQDEGPVLPTVVNNEEEETAVRDFLVELAQKNETVVINNKEMPAKDALTTFNKHIRFMKQGEKGAFTAANITELEDIVALAKDSVPPISIEKVSRQIFDNDDRLREEIKRLDFSPRESRKPTENDVSFLRGSQAIVTDANMTNEDLLTKYEDLWTQFSKNPYNEELEKKVRDVQNELAMRNPKKGEKPSDIINNVMGGFVGRLNKKADDTATPIYLRKAINTLQDASRSLSAAFRKEEISVEELTAGRDRFESTFNSLLATGISFVEKTDPILNMVKKVMNKISIQESDKFSRDDIEGLLEMQRDMNNLVSAAAELSEAEQETALVALVKSQSAFVTASQLANTEPPTFSELEEKAEAIVNYIDSKREVKFTDAERKDALIDARYKVNNNKVFIIDDIPHTASFTTNGTPVLQQMNVVSTANVIQKFTKEELVKKKKIYDSKVVSNKTLTNIVLRYFDDSNFANAGGQFKFFFSDLVDFGRTMAGGEMGAPLRGWDAARYQTGLTESINLLGTAKDLIFDDPRLSDQDLAIVKDFVIAVKHGGIIGERRAVAALGLIHSMQMQSLMLNSNDLDKNNEQKLVTRFEKLDDADYKKLSGKEKTIHDISNVIGINLKDKTHASVAFNLLLDTLGIEVMSKEEVMQKSNMTSTKMSEAGNTFAREYNEKLEYAMGVFKMATDNIEMYANPGLVGDTIPNHTYVNAFSINEETGVPDIFNDLNINWDTLRLQEDIAATNAGQ